MGHYDILVFVKIYKKFVIFLAIVGVASVITAQFLSLFSSLGFEKILHYCALVYALIGFLIFRKAVQKKSIVSLGLVRTGGWKKNI